MKKIMALVLPLVFILALAGCGSETIHLEFPFAVDDVENVELYHFDGVPVAAKKKVIVEEEAIKDLYEWFEALPLEQKEVEETTGAEITSFRFNLADGTDYALVYGSYGVKTGNLKSSTGDFEYFTSADIGAFWTNTDLEAVPVDESELP